MRSAKVTKAAIPVLAASAALLATPSNGAMRPQECIDGRDNDANGLVDLNDPGCLSEADYHEGG